jgi:UDP-N-acetylmuramate dehydrogenase
MHPQPIKPLPENFPAQLIEQSVPLNNKNWFNTGGPARFFAQPATAEQLQTVLQFAQQQSIPVFMLGKGANILISDAGFDGLVINSALTAVSVVQEDGDYVYVQAGAGTAIPDLITWCLENNIGGLEEFSGIPGTVGGAVYINLHYFEFLLSQFLVSAQVIDKYTCQLTDVGNAWFNFGYNQSTLLHGTHYLATATFKLKKLTAEQAAFACGRSIEIIRHRNARYPAKNTCGSFFRNFHADEVTVMSNDKKMIYVAYYLDKIGVKGALEHGDAIVSYQHANMIVNRGNATSNDIIMLARTMQQLVRDKFGITPQPECRLIGFADYPLL